MLHFDGDTYNILMTNPGKKIFNYIMMNIAFV
jgi:hypothetical protein